MFKDFNRENWVSYLANNKVQNDGLLDEETEKAYEKFLLDNAYDEEKRNIFHKSLQEDVDLEILRVAREEEQFEDLEMYKIYASKLEEVETIEEDEILNSEFDW
ncbi:MAG: hypothetical protein ACRDD2_02945 [Sarcina sp.]